MKSFLLPLITLPLWFTSVAYACEAHHSASQNNPKQTITTKYHDKIQSKVSTKADTVTNHQHVASQNIKASGK